MFSSGRILVLDGAMGTMIQRSGFTGDNESLNLSNPDLIEGIHRAYIEAGADIIETNTFGANRLSQGEYSLAGAAREMALEGARIARRAASSAPRKILIAGSVGPTPKSLSLAVDASDPSRREVSFDEMVSVYDEQIGALLEGGVDLILIETCFDALNAKAALYALSKLSPGFPAAVSVSLSGGRTLTGQSIEAFYTAVSHYPLAAFGLNCSMGAADMLPLLKEVSRFAECPVICFPNAGLPNESGGYDETPAHMAEAVRKMASEGLVNIVGGCCGTTPEHIEAIAEAVKGLPGRTLPEPGRKLMVSGLESVTVDKSLNFTLIGERTNVAGSRRFRRLISEGAYGEALEIAAEQISAGASIIDVNFDDAMLSPSVEMERFTRLISGEPSVARAALMIDSSHWEAVLAGLKNSQGKCIVNSISLAVGEEEFLRRAMEIHSLGAAMVVMAFDEKGQATDYQRKISICERAYRLLTGAGIPPQDIIFDCNILSVGTGMREHARYAVDFIEAVRWIKNSLPGARTSGGVSNLSFAFRGNPAVREAMHSAFLYHAIRAGLDMAIVNPSMLEIYENIPPDLLEAVEDVIFDRREDAADRLAAMSSEVPGSGHSVGGSPVAGRQASAAGASAGYAAASAPAGSAVGATTAASAESVSPDERLSALLVKGSSAGLEEAVLECYARLGSAVAVIEGPLMKGMEKVGELFGAGKMFLPQVVKSARVMKEAVAVLDPYMKAGEEDGARPVVVIATVKGDVHDIGKNITATVLTCNGFEVVDLGVMVDTATILDEAACRNAAIIAVSGLITPSLVRMEEICREMTSRGMTIPLFVGGATTSALHTAVKLAPLYAHVFHGADASASAVMAKRILSDREAFETAQHAAQEQLRALHFQSSSRRQAAAPGQSAISTPGQPAVSSEPSPPAAPATESDQAAISAHGQPAAPATEAGQTATTAEARQARPCCHLPAATFRSGLFAIDAAEAAKRFDDHMFLAIWGIRYGKADLNSPAVRETLAECHATLDRMLLRDEVEILCSTRFFDASSRPADGPAAHDTYSRPADTVLNNAALNYTALNETARPADSAAARDVLPLPTDGIDFIDGYDPCAEFPVISLPFLRQGSSLADFIAPAPSGKRSPFGMFALSVRRKGHKTGCDCEACKGDGLLERTIRMVLAEAASCLLDEMILASIPKDASSHLRPYPTTFSAASSTALKVIKPAAGYASCPDHSLKKDILALLPSSERLGITLTDSYAMSPEASICGFIFLHPDASYPEIRSVPADILERYATLRGFTPDESHRLLSHLL